MIDKLKNGDTPAMPFVVPGDVCMQPFDGMTKREIMAMHLMAALLSGNSMNRSFSAFADSSVRAADALLTALEKTK